MSYVTKTLWLGCRVGAVGYVAYALDQEGVFCHKADPDATVAKLRAKVPAEAADLYNQIPSPGFELSSLSSLFSRENWNWAVVETGYHLQRIPQYCSCASNYVKESINGVING